MLASDSPVTFPSLSIVTPYQLLTGSLLSQFVLSVQFAPSVDAYNASSTPLSLSHEGTPAEPRSCVVTLYRAPGIQPLRLFPLRCNVARLESPVSPLGIIPLSALLANDSPVTFPALSIVTPYQLLTGSLLSQLVLTVQFEPSVAAYNASNTPLSLSHDDTPAESRSFVATLYRAPGIQPLRPFPLRCSVSRLESPVRPPGIVPLNALLASDSPVTFPSLSIVTPYQLLTGSLLSQFVLSVQFAPSVDAYNASSTPLSLSHEGTPAEPRSCVVTLYRAPGIQPLRLFPLRCNVARPESPVSPLGIVPLSALLANDNPVTLPSLSIETPYQLLTGSLLSQFVLSFQFAPSVALYNPSSSALSLSHEGTPAESRSFVATLKRAPGIQPLRLFPLNCNVARLSRPANSLGIAPTNALPASDSAVTSPSELVVTPYHELRGSSLSQFVLSVQLVPPVALYSATSGPLSIPQGGLPAKSRSCVEISKRVSGIQPTRLFPLRCSVLRLSSSVSRLGTVPLKAFPAKDSPVTRPLLSVVTPYHEPNGSVLNQFVLSVQVPPSIRLYSAVSVFRSAHDGIPSSCVSANR